MILYSTLVSTHLCLYEGHILAVLIKTLYGKIWLTITNIIDIDRAGYTYLFFDKLDGRLFLINLFTLESEISTIFKNRFPVSF